MENDIVRAIAAEINNAEAALRRADALATGDFRTKFDAAKVQKVEVEMDKVGKRLALLHRALNAALATATFPRDRSGK